MALLQLYADLFKGGITNSAVRQKLGKLCNYFCEGESIAEDTITISPVLDESYISRGLRGGGGHKAMIPLLVAKAYLHK